MLVESGSASACESLSIKFATGGTKGREIGFRQLPCAFAPSNLRLALFHAYN